MMRIMALMALAGLLCPLAAAFSVSPDFIEVQDTGNENNPKLDVGISTDCGSKEVLVSVASDEDGAPVEGAKAYLFYTDYTYQALPNPGTTDADGNAMIPVPGTLRFLTAMFTLRVDKQGFMSREIEFTYEKCFGEPPEEVAPEAPEEEAGTTGMDEQEGESYGSLDEAVPEGEAAQDEAADAASEADEAPEDAGDAPPATEPPGPAPGSGPCPAGLALAALLFARMRA